MTISLSSAEAAVSALKGVGGLQPTEKNKHLFQKHYSKAEAMAQAGPTMSWFEIQKTLSISQVSDAKNLAANRLPKLAKVMGVRTKQVKPELQKLDSALGKSYALTVTDDVGLYGMMEIIKKCLAQPCSLYSN